MDLDSCLALARILVLNMGQSPEEASENSAIPPEFREEVKNKLLDEQTVTFSPARVIGSAGSDKWLEKQDRRTWYYWIALRGYLSQRLEINRIRYLDDSTDQILGRLGHPDSEDFEKRGLVLGYVQSGKTANYSALIAKAADVGYKFFIVLSGIDKALRLQTQIRLQDELTGYSNGNRDAVPYPELGKRWSVFTSPDINGDFNPGSIDLGASSPPFLAVIKKNSSVIKRLLLWLKRSPSNVRNSPLLLIDDESDQASIDISADRNEPSTINRLIREILSCFGKKSYVAYTATPFANILIPADLEHPDPSIGSDIYPQDFIIDLPKSEGYVGAEDLFGRFEFTGDAEGEDGIDILRIFGEEEDVLDSDNHQPLNDALMDFVLAGVARIKRDGDQPATMLVHVSRLIDDQQRVRQIVEYEFKNIRDLWRYENNGEIKKCLIQRWEDFLRVTKEFDSTIPLFDFEDLVDGIGPFLESIEIKELNSESDDFLNYDQEPRLKSIAIGGDKLSRGLTLEGLLVSYFSRTTQRPMYDTLMQMGRWFGYRKGYVDLTRIYTTQDIADHFAHLSRVEHQLRDDLQIYDNRGVSPRKVGMRILAHPAMLVTNRLKQRNATEFRVSHSRRIFETFRFPLDDLEEISSSSDKNLQAVKKLLSCDELRNSESSTPLWEGVNVEQVLEFLNGFTNKEHENEIESIIRYINRVKQSELRFWNIAVMMPSKKDERFGTVDWGFEVNQISRSRLYHQVKDLKSIVGSRDELRFLSPTERQNAEELCNQEDSISLRMASRCIRSPDQGLLMLYPISKNSIPFSSKRRPLFSNSEDPLARDLIGLAISFPQSKIDMPEAFIHGRPGWQN